MPWLLACSTTTGGAAFWATATCRAFWEAVAAATSRWVVESRTWPSVTRASPTTTARRLTTTSTPDTHTVDLRTPRPAVLRRGAGSKTRSEGRRGPDGSGRGTARAVDPRVEPVTDGGTIRPPRRWSSAG